MITKTKSGFAPTQQLIRAAEHVLVCKAFEQQIRPVVEAYETAILAKHHFRPDPKYREHLNVDRILDRKVDYLMSAEDSQVYHAECFKARDAAGLKVSRPENCPLLEARNLLLEAENAFIIELGTMPGLEVFASKRWSLDLKQRAQVIDLGLRLVAPFVAQSNEILGRLLHPEAASGAGGTNAIAG